eukprot:72734-Rhodomonas_salina.2
MMSTLRLVLFRIPGSLPILSSNDECSHSLSHTGTSSLPTMSLVLSFSLSTVLSPDDECLCQCAQSLSSLPTMSARALSLDKLLTQQRRSKHDSVPRSHGGGGSPGTQPEESDEPEPQAEDGADLRSLGGGHWPQAGKFRGAPGSPRNQITYET